MGSGSHDQDSCHSYISRSDRFFYPSTFASNISSEATHVSYGVSLGPGNKFNVYSDGLGHMVRFLQKSFPELQGY